MTREKQMPICAVIGAGLIGRAWAMVFARSGWSVRITDVSAEARAAAPALLAEALAEQVRHGLVEDAAACIARITVCDSLEAAADGVDFVQESGPETVEAKLALFAALDRAAPPGAILSSSSSAIVASKYTEALPGRGRCLVGHPVNPPHLVPIVELCPSPWTTPDTMRRARAVYEEIGQVPITVKREIEGFVLNRLQGALLAEAFRLVENDVVSAEDLDKTIAHGLGLRWSFMGPFETIDLNAPGGIKDYCARYTGFYKRLQAEPATPRVYEAAETDKIVAGWPLATTSAAGRADKTRWRDGRLAALAAFKRKQKPFAG